MCCCRIVDKVASDSQLSRAGTLPMRRQTTRYLQTYNILNQIHPNDTQTCQLLEVYMEMLLVRSSANIHDL